MSDAARPSSVTRRLRAAVPRHKPRQESAAASRRPVLVALAANVGVAVAKFIAAVATGSSAMLAEGLHSLADSVNEVLLLFGAHRSERPPDPLHPFGYGRYRYITAFVVSLTVFWIGGVFALFEGVSRLSAKEGVQDPTWAFAVLLIAATLEGWSLRTTVRTSRRRKGGRPWRDFLKTTRTPELLVVFLEDLGALVGLAVAGIGLLASVVTRQPLWDAVASMVIGVLLMAVGSTILVKTQSLLVGESATDEVVGAIRAALAGVDGFEEIVELRTIHGGPDDVFVAARVLVDPSRTAREISVAIAEAHLRVDEATAHGTQLFVQPETV